ncbi:MAG: hypothetical protein LQ344_003577, partial [Seirophora lacunosa]
MLFLNLVAVWCLSLASTVQAQTSSSTPQTGSSLDIECYDFDGKSDFDRNQQCPGSQTCCKTRDRCLPNKMCLNDGELVRPPCAIYPWSNSTCSPLCLFVTGTGMLPRIQMCPDGSYCCNDDALCCSKGAGKFVGPDGNIISNPYTTDASTTSAATPTSPAAAATTVQDTPTAAESGSGGLSSAAKGAIGALAGVLLLTIIAAGFFIRRKRRQVSSLKSRPAETQPMAQEPHGRSYFAPKAETGYGRAELG